MKTREYKDAFFKLIKTLLEIIHSTDEMFDKNIIELDTIIENYDTHDRFKINRLESYNDLR